MSYIANAIDELLKEHNTNGADLARKTGLNPAQISRWKNAEQKSIKPDCLLKLAEGFCPNRKTERFVKTHARLLHAHLLDECIGPGAKYITIEMPNNPNPILVATARIEESVLPPNKKKNLDVVEEQMKNKNRLVSEIIRVLAENCEE
jgi:DNA-binding Xre family transcriptional regulator